MGFAIVVDASVARSAGESGKPQPEACRQALLAILDHNHRLAMSALVRKEWMKTRPGNPIPYATLFALRWLTQMQSAGRVDEITLEENSPLRQRCLGSLQHNNQTITSVGAVAKDFHLVETALQADQRVVSLDVKIVGHLARLRETAEEICSVMWVHPVIHQSETWLRDGAPGRTDCRVC